MYVWGIQMLGVLRKFCLQFFLSGRSGQIDYMATNFGKIYLGGTHVQSKHAPVMILMGNAATMARPRSVELAGSFMDIYRSR
ncbi:unnamed protein product [Ectocarpus sp. 6 AP-2014]